MLDNLTETQSDELKWASIRRRRPLHIIQFIAGVAIVPLAVWLFMQGDLRGGVLTAIVAVIAIAYAGINLFFRPWPYR
jgi:heme/copper-type cytochrome/quinol oxidase subunit 4